MGTPDFSDGVMVALYPELSVAKKLALPDGQDPEDMHVTLAYIGNKGDEGVPDGEDWPQLHDIVRSVAKRHAPQEAQVTGTGKFMPGDDGTPFVGIVGSHTIHDLHKDLVSELKGRGIPVSDKYPFNPHLTLDYLQDGDEEPDPLTEAVPLTFGRMTSKYGEQAQHHDFGKEPIAKAAAVEEDVPKLPDDVASSFEAVGRQQRGEPEAAMLRVQHAAGGGVLSFVAEHVGDLTHRMTHHVGYGTSYPEIVEEKVKKTLRTLRSGYGFQKEHKENMEENGSDPSAVDAALGEYADAHRRLPVYNRPQWLGREAAVAVGDKDWSRATTHLSELNILLETGKFHGEAMSYKQNEDGSLRQHGMAVTSAKEMIPCTVCNGKGEHLDIDNYDDKMVRCTHCKGSGIVALAASGFQRAPEEVEDEPTDIPAHLERDHGIPAKDIADSGMSAEAWHEGLHSEKMDFDLQQSHSHDPEPFWERHKPDMEYVSDIGTGSYYIPYCKCGWSSNIRSEQAAAGAWARHVNTLDESGRREKAGPATPHRHHPDVLIPKRHAMEFQQCWNCNGTGDFQGEACWRCKGSGIDYDIGEGYCTKHNDSYHHTVPGQKPTCFKGTPNDPCEWEKTAKVAAEDYAACRGCKGKGTYRPVLHEDKESKCPMCKGTGLEGAVQEDGTRKMAAEWQPCDACDGAGVYGKDDPWECPRCTGTGIRHPDARGRIVRRDNDFDIVPEKTAGNYQQCGKCLGDGCPRCNGTGLMEQPYGKCSKHGGTFHMVVNGHPICGLGDSAHGDFCSWNSKTAQTVPCEGCRGTGYHSWKDFTPEEDPYPSLRPEGHSVSKGYEGKCLGCGGTGVRLETHCENCRGSGIDRDSSGNFIACESCGGTTTRQVVGHYDEDDEDHDEWDEHLDEDGEPQPEHGDYVIDDSKVDDDTNEVYEGRSRRDVGALAYQVGGGAKSYEAEATKGCEKCDNDGWLACEKCKGTGAQPNTHWDACAGCGGTTKRNGKDCEFCKGSGLEAQSEDCTKCFGSGRQHDNEGNELACPDCGGEGNLPTTQEDVHKEIFKHQEKQGYFPNIWHTSGGDWFENCTHHKQYKASAMEWETCPECKASGTLPAGVRECPNCEAGSKTPKIVNPEGPSNPCFMCQGSGLARALAQCDTCKGQGMVKKAHGENEHFYDEKEGDWRSHTEEEGESPEHDEYGGGHHDYFDAEGNGEDVHPSDYLIDTEKSDDEGNDYAKAVEYSGGGRPGMHKTELAWRSDDYGNKWEPEPFKNCDNCKGDGYNPCSDCKGTGEDAKKVDRCGYCRGSGLNEHFETCGGCEGKGTQPSACDRCDGQGHDDDADVCEKCGGEGSLPSTHDDLHRQVWEKQHKDGEYNTIWHYKSYGSMEDIKPCKHDKEFKDWNEDFHKGKEQGACMTCKGSGLGRGEEGFKECSNCGGDGKGCPECGYHTSEQLKTAGTWMDQVTAPYQQDAVADPKDDIEPVVPPQYQPDFDPNGWGALRTVHPVDVFSNPKTGQFVNQQPVPRPPVERYLCDRCDGSGERSNGDICGSCKGSGLSRDRHDQDCTMCGGTGKCYDEHFANPKAYPKGFRIPCKGNCVFCGATGKLTTDDLKGLDKLFPKTAMLYVREQGVNKFHMWPEHDAETTYCGQPLPAKGQGEFWNEKPPAKYVCHECFKQHGDDLAEDMREERETAIADSKTDWWDRTDA